MVPFIILLTVPIVIAPFVKNIKINQVKLKYLPLFLFFLMMTFLVIFRHKFIGNDTDNYINYFTKFSMMSWGQIGNADMEIGFVIYCKIIALFTKDPRIFIIISGVLVSAMMYPTYRRLCVDPSLTIVLFCTMSTFSMMFSGIRQMLAIGIGIIAYELTRRKKLIFFIIAVIVALSIHTSAFMLAFMYPLFYARITRKWLFFVVPVLVAVFIFNRQVFSVLSIVLSRFTKYEAVQTLTGAYTMLFVLVAFAVICYVIPDESLIDDETMAMRNFLLLTIMIQMFAPLNFWAMRMGLYYMIFVPLLMPRVLKCTSERFRQFALIIRYIMIGFFFVYFFYSQRDGGGLHITPYHFYWEYYYI